MRFKIVFLGQHVTGLELERVCGSGDDAVSDDECEGCCDQADFGVTGVGALSARPSKVRFTASSPGASSVFLGGH